jgi:hypothetical protein
MLKKTKRKGIKLKILKIGKDIKVVSYDEKTKKIQYIILKNGEKKEKVLYSVVEDKIIVVVPS